MSQIIENLEAHYEIHEVPFGRIYHWRNDGRDSTRKEAEKAKTQAREVVELLEQARKLMAEDSVVQPAMDHLYATLHEAEGRATVLEDWYQRTYL